MLTISVGVSEGAFDVDGDNEDVVVGVVDGIFVGNEDGASLGAAVGNSDNVFDGKVLGKGFGNKLGALLIVTAGFLLVMSLGEFEGTFVGNKDNVGRWTIRWD